MKECFSEIDDMAQGRTGGLTDQCTQGDSTWTAKRDTESLPSQTEINLRSPHNFIISLLYLGLNFITF